MNRSSPRRTPVQGLLLLLLALGVLAWKARPNGAGDMAREPARNAPREAASATRIPDAGDAVAAPAGLVEAVPADTPPDHVGQHGDECAHCLAEKRLTAYREDYAAMLLARASEDRDADPVQEERIREACRRVAAAVLTGWSFSESRPVLAPDPVVEARRREWLDPVLASIPRKPPAD